MFQRIKRNSKNNSSHPQHSTQTQDTPTDSIISLQQTFGNAATQQYLNTPAPHQENFITSLQPIIGNAGVQRMLNQPPTSSDGATKVQRRLSITSDQLTGKNKSGMFKELKDKALSSAFVAVKSALDNYHKIPADDIEGQIFQLRDIIIKADKWLGDQAHLKLSDDQKRAGLENLKRHAEHELKRMQIVKELGVPRLIAELFDEKVVNDFYTVVAAFKREDARTGLAVFQPLKRHLGDSAILVETMMKRNQIHVIAPDLAASINSSGFQMNNPKGSEGAIELVKKEAEAKLEELKDLEKKHVAAQAAIQAMKNNPGSKKVTPDDLPADKRAIYDYNIDNDYPADPMTLLHFPILVPNTPQYKTYMKLQMEKQHYESIKSGDAVNKKKGEQGFENFSETELYGLMGYTSNLYEPINSPLRYDVGGKKFTEGHTALAGSIISALHKMKPYTGTVYRHGGDFPGYAQVNVAGATVSDMAPLSTAVDQKGPANAAESHQVLEILTSITGRDVSKASMFGGKEGEILFQPGTRFKVIATFERNQVFWGKNNDRSQWTIRSQEKHPLFQQAMAAVERDDKKHEFHRVVIKAEIS